MALSEVDRLTRPRSIPAGDSWPEYPQEQTKARQAREKAAKWLKKLGGTGSRTLRSLRDSTAPVFSQAKAHVLTVAAFACADWAACLWNEKSALITAAVL